METMETINYQQEQELQYSYEYEEYKAYQLYMHDKLVNKIKYKSSYNKLYLTTEEAIFLLQNPELKPGYILLQLEGTRYYLY